MRVWVEDGEGAIKDFGITSFRTRDWEMIGYMQSLQKALINRPHVCIVVETIIEIPLRKSGDEPIRR